MEEKKEKGIYITSFVCKKCGNKTTWMTGTSQLDKEELCSECL